jgi:hypothetical protein
MREVRQRAMVDYACRPMEAARVPTKESWIRKQCSVNQGINATVCVT